MSADLIPLPQPEPEPQDPVLTITQRRGLLALLTHPNIRQAAKSIGIHERTLRRWLGTPNFRDALDGLLEATQDDLLTDLERGAFTAVKTLTDIAGNRYSDATGRITASKHLLDFCERRTLRHDLVSLLRRP